MVALIALYAFATAFLHQNIRKLLKAYIHIYKIQTNLNKGILQNPSMLFALQACLPNIPWVYRQRSNPKRKTIQETAT